MSHEDPTLRNLLLELRDANAQLLVACRELEGVEGRLDTYLAERSQEQDAPKPEAEAAATQSGTGATTDTRSALSFPEEEQGKSPSSISGAAASWTSRDCELAAVPNSTPPPSAAAAAAVPKSTPPPSEEQQPTWYVVCEVPSHPDTRYSFSDLRGVHWSTRDALVSKFWGRLGTPSDRLGVVYYEFSDWQEAQEKWYSHAFDRDPQTLTMPPNWH
jgi:hypothetical protein